MELSYRSGTYLYSVVNNNGVYSVRVYDFSNPNNCQLLHTIPLNNSSPVLSIWGNSSGSEFLVADGSKVYNYNYDNQSGNWNSQTLLDLSSYQQAGIADIAVSETGILYLLLSDGTLKAYSKNGGSVTEIASVNAVEVNNDNFPKDLEVNGNAVYVAYVNGSHNDDGGLKIYVLNNGSFSFSTEISSMSVNDVAAGPNGEAYIVDSESNKVIKVTFDEKQQPHMTEIPINGGIPNEVETDGTRVYVRVDSQNQDSIKLVDFDSQSVQDVVSGGNYGDILPFKYGNEAYLVISNAGTFEPTLYDVENVSNPQVISLPPGGETGGESGEGGGTPPPGGETGGESGEGGGTPPPGGETGGESGESGGTPPPGGETGELPTGQGCSQSDDFPDSINDINDDTPNAIIDFSGQNNQNSVSKQGQIDCNMDSDYFKVKVENGKAYKVSISGNAYAIPVDSQGNFLFDINIKWLPPEENSQSGSSSESPEESTLSFQQPPFIIVPSGDFYIDVMGMENEGNYTLTIEEQDFSSTSSSNDDAPDYITSNIQTIQLSNSQGSTNGSLEVEGDRDIYKFTATQGKYYKVTIPLLNDVPQGTWIGVMVADSNGRVLWDGVSQIQEQNRAGIIFQANQAGDYYVLVEGGIPNDNNGSDNVKYNYDLKIEEVTINDDIPDYTHAVTVDLSSNNSFSSNNTIELSGDKDYFKLSALQGDSYEIVVKDNDDNSDLFPHIDIVQIDQNGTETYVVEGVSYQPVDPSEFSNPTGIREKLTFTPQSNGDYYIVVQDWNTGDYTVEVREITDDHPNSINANFADSDDVVNLGSQAAQTDVTVTGSIETLNDVDYLKLNVEQGKTYQIELSIDSNQMLFPFLDVLDQSGMPVSDVQWLYVNDTNPSDGLTIEKLSFIPSTDGPFYLMISGDGFNTGDYTVKVKKIDLQQNPDNHPDSISDSFGSDDIFDLNNTDSNGYSSISGTINTATDVDYFKLPVEAGKVYEIDLSSSNGYPWIDVYKSDGSSAWDEIDVDWSSGNKLYLVPQSDGNYFIAVGDWQEGTNYTVKVKEVNVQNDDHPNSVRGTFSTDDIFDFQNSNEDSINVSKNSNFDPDYLKLHANAGETYEFWIETNSNSFYPWLKVVDFQGNDVYDVQYLWEGNQEKVAFTPSSEGDYYISVEGTGIGSCTVHARRFYLNQDDHADSVNEVTDNDVINLSNGQADVSASLESLQDVDVFKLPVESGNYYKIQIIRPGDSTQEWRWAYADVLDEYGIPLWETDKWDEVTYVWEDFQNHNQNQYVVDSFVLSPSESTDYYIKVDGDTGNYIVHVEKQTLQQDDHPDKIDDIFGSDDTFVASLINSSGTTQNGNLGAEFDKDIFKFTVDANSVGKEFEIKLTTSDSDFYPYFDILDNNGNYVWENVEWNWDNLGNGEVEKITFTPSEQGDYYIRVAGWQTGDYDLTIRTTSTQDVPSDNSTTATVAVNDSNGYTGSLETATDEDWIKVNLTVGNVYKFTIESKDTDVYAQLLDSSGSFLAFDDDSGEGTNAEFYYKANSDGDYYIDVGGYSPGDYAVKVEQVDTSSDSEADSTTTTAIINVGGSYQGGIDYPFDVDWIKVSLRANQTYTIDLSGVTLEDTKIAGIYDSYGNLIPNTSNDNKDAFTTDSSLTFTPQATGNYYIAVESALPVDTGTYLLRINQQSSSSQSTSDSEGNDINNTINTAINIDSLGTSVDGTIDYGGDEDMFKVHLVGGRTYGVAMLGADSNEGTLPDPKIIEIEDRSGNKIVDGNDNNGISLDSFVEFTPNQTGDYYIRVSAADSDQIGTYKMVISEIQQNVDIASSSNQGDWTIMVYMAADNNLEPYALKDLNEMEAANLPSNVKVTFLLDRIDGYDDSQGGWSGTKQGIISHDNDKTFISSPMEDVGEKDMGDPNTLKDFINWSIQTAPAQHYALVIWNHGDGIRGAAVDDTDGDYLSISEVAQALRSSNLPNNKVDVLGFDACLMGTLDVLYGVKDVANYIVASEELEPADGWDYEGWFNAVNSDTNGVTTQELVQYAVNSYVSAYNSYPETVTLSAFDTSKVNNVINAFKELNDELRNLNGSTAAQVKSTMSQVEKFGSFDSYIDLKDLADKIENVVNNGSNLYTDADNLKTKVNSLVVSHDSNILDDNSVSIYYPGYNDTDYINNVSLIADVTDLANFFDFFTS